MKKQRYSQSLVYANKKVRCTLGLQSTENFKFFLALLAVGAIRSCNTDSAVQLHLNTEPGCILNM